MILRPLAIPDCRCSTCSGCPSPLDRTCLLPVPSLPTPAVTLCLSGLTNTHGYSDTEAGRAMQQEHAVLSHLAGTGRCPGKLRIAVLEVSRKIAPAGGDSGGAGSAPQYRGWSLGACPTQCSPLTSDWQKAAEGDALSKL